MNEHIKTKLGLIKSNDNFDTYYLYIEQHMVLFKEDNAKRPLTNLDYYIKCNGNSSVINGGLINGLRKESIIDLIKQIFKLNTINK